MTLSITPQQMYADICCDNAELEEFTAWVVDLTSAASFKGYVEGFDDGSQSAQYEIEHGVLNNKEK